jgi:hypothetical protein
MIDRGVCNKSYTTGATSSRDTVIKKERDGDPIDRFHTATLLYLSQAETLISTSYVIFVFWMVWGGIWMLIFVILLVDNHCLSCLFIKLKIRHQQHIPIYLPLSFWWSVNLICLSWSNSCDKASNYKNKKTTLNIEKKYWSVEERNESKATNRKGNKWYQRYKLLIIFPILKSYN